MKIVLSVFIIFFISFQSFSNGAEIIYKNSAEFRKAEFKHIISGKAPSGSCNAITRREFSSRLSGDTVNENNGFNTSMDFTLTPYAAAFFSPYATYGKTYPLQMVYLHDKSIDALKIKADIEYEESLYLKFTYSLSSSAKSISDGWNAHHPLNPDFYSPADSPDEGYISYAKNHFSLTIGRFRGGIGHGLIGNTFQNGKAPYYDQIQLNLYSSKFKFYFMLGSSNHQLSKEEDFIQDRRSDYTDYEKTWGTAYNNRHKQSKISDNSKMFAFHRVEVSPFDKFSFGIGEMNLIGGKFPDLNQINPLGIYHDTYDPDFHSYTFSIDASFVPSPNHFLFSELLINEIEVTGERNEDPTALGAQIGYWYILPTKSSSFHRIAFELTHIDTWTYSDNVPYLTMYQRQYRNQFNYDIPLGYSYGGDCEQFSILYTYISGNNTMIDVTLSHLSKGEINFSPLEDGTMPYEYADKWQARPSGTVEQWSSIDVTSSIFLDSTKSIETTAMYSYIQNFNHKKDNTNHLLYISAGLSWHF